MSLISKPSIDLRKINTLYFILALIVLIILGFLSVIPQVIPSWEIVQEILVGILYILNLILVYFIIRRFQKKIVPYVSKKAGILITSSISFVVVGGVIIMFFFTSLGFGQGFMGATLEKELNYPDYKTTIYIYDAGFLDPATAIKIKKGWLPIMKDVKFLGNWIPYRIKARQTSEIVQIFSQKIQLKLVWKLAN